MFIRFHISEYSCAKWNTKINLRRQTPKGIKAWHLLWIVGAVLF